MDVTVDNRILTPAYSIYDNGVLSKVALINFMDDPSGKSDINVTIAVNGSNVPAQARVK